MNERVFVFCTLAVLSAKSRLFLLSTATPVQSPSLGTAHRLGSGLLSQSVSVLFLNGHTEEGHLKVRRIGQVVLISLSLTVGPHGVPSLFASSKHH